MPLEFLLDHTIDISQWDGNPRCASLKSLFIEIEKRVGRAPNLNNVQLSETENKWKQLGFVAPPRFELDELAKESTIRNHKKNSVLQEHSKTNYTERNTNIISNIQDIRNNFIGAIIMVAIPLYCIYLFIFSFLGISPSSIFHLPSFILGFWKFSLC